MSPSGEEGVSWVWNRIVAFLLDLGWMKHFGNDTSSTVKFSYGFVQY